MKNQITKLYLLDDETMISYGDMPNAPVWVGPVHEICRQISENGKRLIRIEINSWDDLISNNNEGRTRLIKRAQRIAKMSGHVLQMQDDKYFLKKEIVG